MVDERIINKRKEVRENFLNQELSKWELALEERIFKQRGSIIEDSGARMIWCTMNPQMAKTM